MDELQAIAQEEEHVIHTVPTDFFDEEFVNTLEGLEMFRRGGTLSVSIDEDGMVTVRHKYKQGMEHVFEVLL